MTNPFEQIPKFDPHDKKYQKTADVPENEQANYVDSENGFIGKQAAKEFKKANKDADIDNKWRRTFVDKLLRRNKLKGTDVIQEGYEGLVRTTIGRIKDGKKVSEEFKKAYGIDMPDTSPEYKEEMEKLTNEYNNIWTEFVAVSNKIEKLEEKKDDDEGGMPLLGGSDSGELSYEDENKLSKLQEQEFEIQSRLQKIRDKQKELSDQLK